MTLTEYKQFDVRRKAYDAKLADKQDEVELLTLENKLKSRTKK